MYTYQDEDMVSSKHAAKICGVHPHTIRVWSAKGKLPHIRINERGDRRYKVLDLKKAMGHSDMDKPDMLKVALYSRVSESTGQEISLAAQTREMQDIVSNEENSRVVAQYQDKAERLNENRPRLNKLLTAARKREFDAVYIIHEDHLARFDVGWASQLLHANNVQLRVINMQTTQTTIQDELVADLVALVTCFSGRIYAQRTAQSQRKLLAIKHPVQAAEVAAL